MTNESSGMHDKHRLTRERDGTARLRIRFSKEEADAMEVAAGSTPIVDWIHATLRGASSPQ
jgi:hypothetical protein